MVIAIDKLFLFTVWLTSGCLPRRADAEAHSAEVPELDNLRRAWSDFILPDLMTAVRAQGSTRFRSGAQVWAGQAAGLAKAIPAGTLAQQIWTVAQGLREFSR